MTYEHSDDLGLLRSLSQLSKRDSRIKLDIQEGSAPVHLECTVPHRLNFQGIHLGGAFMEALCKPNNRSPQSPRATAPTPPSAFKTGPHAPLSRESFTLLSPISWFLLLR
ncbi:hypothetical protein AVEN_163575-1 [Araneus ventricosus]|uniref:Uncharacterized protein n=1 Tax=Araneus ventricosus TaxID=182803 RepID=A0A4Y2LVT8_ARAVE|nr:hypothetical protein AVEN_163575-1 [Araneus ventricosus]